MLFDAHSILLLWLHEGGWDEVIMVAAGLVVAYLVIVWSGRRKDEDDDDLGLDDDDERDAPQAPNEPSTDRPPHQRP